MNSRFSADVNKSVRLDTVFRPATAAGALNARDVKQVHTNLSARCCSNFHSACSDPVANLLSNAGIGIKSLALRTALSIYPSPARAVAVSRHSLQRSSVHVHSLIENLQKPDSENKENFVASLDRALSAAAPLMKYGEINFDEILRARIGSMQLEKKQCSQSLSRTKTLLKKEDLCDELRFNLRVINEALTSLKQRPALVLSSEKVLLARSLIDNDKCLATLKEFLQCTSSKSAEKVFSTLEKNVQKMLLSVDYFNKTETLIEGLQVVINQQNISMTFIKEMICKHGLSLLMQSNEKTNPPQQLKLSLSYLSPLKRQELAQANYKVESASLTQLRDLSHVYGQRKQLAQIKNLGPVLEKIILSNQQDRMKDLRKNMVTKYQVLTLIDAAAKVAASTRSSASSSPISSSDLIYRTLSTSIPISTSSQKTQPIKIHFGVNKLIHKSEYSSLLPHDFKNEVKKPKVTWNELPEKIPHIVSTTQYLQEIIDYKKVLRENAIYSLHSLLETFARSVRAQDATTRFEEIERAALRFVQKYSPLRADKHALSDSAKKLIIQKYENLRDRLIKDMLIIVFPVQATDTKRIRPIVERPAEQLLPTIGRALCLLAVKKIDQLIDAESGYLLISGKERADVHRISHKARLDKQPQNYFNHPELDLFDDHFKKSSDDLADFFWTILKN
jgi:hypothetical protein